MIVRSENDHFVLIRQTDHAALAGVFAESWGNDDFARPEPLDALCLASAQHDIGWEEWERQPKADPATRYPYQFTDLPVEEHLKFYLRGIARVLEKDRYAGLLVSLHCSGIYKQRYGTDPGLKLRRFTPDVEHVVQQFMERLEKQQQELRAALRATLPGCSLKDAAAAATPCGAVEEKILWTNYKILQIVDRLSLYFCMASPSARSLGPAPVSYGGQDTELHLEPVASDTVCISPYPFRKSPLRVSVEACAIPMRPYDDQQLCEAFTRATLFPLSFLLQRGV